MQRIAVNAKRRNGPEMGPRPPGGNGEAASALQGKVVPTREDVKTESPRKTDRLMEEVADPANLNEAWRRVRSNHGAPGVDGITIEAFPEWLKTRKAKLIADLKGGSYRPQPLRRVKLPKPNGGERLLGIPTVLDRVVQQAILQILQPILDPSFSDYSYGFRPNRSAHQAIYQAQEYIQAGYTWVVDIDLAAFFDRVNHDRLMTRLSHAIADKRLRWIIRGFLRAGVLEGGVVRPTTEGTPQGGPLSPLLANYVLDELDQELTERGLRFVRYADDCNVYVRSQRAAERAFANLCETIEGKLKLRVNYAKSAVARPWRRKLLGFSFTHGPAYKRRIAPQSIAKLKQKVRRLTRHGQARFEGIMHALKRVLIGWRSYFGIGQTRDVLRVLDGWIRCRLRAMLWRRWKTCATRRSELVKRGVSATDAAKLAGSSLGCWPVAHMTPLHCALPNSWFATFGLPVLQPAR